MQMCICIPMHILYLRRAAPSISLAPYIPPVYILREGNRTLIHTIAGAGRPKCRQAQVLAQRQRRAPVARPYTVGRPRLLQSLLPRLALRRGAEAVIQAQALGVSELYLGVQVRIYRMDHSGIRRAFYILQCFCCSCSIM